MAYILILNPQILSDPYVIAGDAGKWREIKPLTAIVALIFVARYAFMTLG